MVAVLTVRVKDRKVGRREDFLDDRLSIELLPLRFVNFPTSSFGI